MGARAAWDYETDVLVIGAGGAGLPASVAAAEKGAKVIALEKNHFCGGDALFAQDTGGATSRHAKTATIVGPPPPMDIAFAMLTNTWMGNPDVVRSVMMRNDDTLNWLEEMGVVYDPTHKWTKYLQALGMPIVSHMPIDPDHPEEGFYRWHPHNAKGFIKALEKRARALGVEILASTPAIGLLQEAGRVIGVEAQTKEGKKLSIRSGGVVLASGGFGANKNMIKKYALPRRAEAIAYYIGCSSNTGDGIRMAQAIGADLEAMDALMIWDGGMPGIGEGPGAFYSAATQLVRQPSLTVNKLGKRFFNEATMVGFLFEGQSNAIQRQKDMTSFTIHDAETVQKRFIIERFDPLYCEYPCPWFENSLEKWVAEGVIIKADTIEDLARLMSVDLKTLRETVDRYNEYCDRGQDPEYFKPGKYLAPIRKAPYYAVKQVGGALINTWGGLRVNGNFQVLDQKWDIIPGLYGAGEAMAWGGYLQMAFNSGRIAGEHAAKEALGK